MTRVTDMKVIIIGATGRSGFIVTEKALEQGHAVTALVRNPSKLNISHPRLTVISGNVLDYSSVDLAMAQQEAVLCALGMGQSSPKTALSEGMKNIVKAMEKHGVRRIICELSVGIDNRPLPPGFDEIAAEHRRQLSILRQTHLDWIAVCPPIITEYAATGQYRLIANVMPQGFVQISKFDLADFMLSQLMSDEYLQKTVGIAY
jgi:putative NADH-flavin reductase